MKTKYDDNPLLYLYNILNNVIANIQNIEDIMLDGVDDVMKAILTSNNCTISEDSKSIVKGIYDDFCLCFISNAKGNELYGHEWYDFINFYGYRYIVVFTDYFKTMKYDTIEDDSTDISKIADNFIGNSLQFNAICTIVNLYIQQTMKCDTDTIQGNINCIAPIIIAASIINSVRQLQDNDIDGCNMPMKDIMELLEKPIELVLLGIF